MLMINFSDISCYLNILFYVNNDIICKLIKFVIPSKEIHEQMKSNIRTSVYCKIRLVGYMVQDELTNKITGIIHNELIM